jgi:hypothetical protein
VLTTVPTVGRKTVTEVVQLTLRGADVRVLVVHLIMRGASATPHNLRSVCPIIPTISFLLEGPLTEG